jgi:hypothetical protein
MDKSIRSVDMNMNVNMNVQSQRPTNPNERTWWKRDPISTAVPWAMARRRSTAHAYRTVETTRALVFTVKPIFSYL